VAAACRSPARARPVGASSARYACATAGCGKVTTLGQAAGGFSQLACSGSTGRGVATSGARYAYVPTLLRAAARVGRLGEWGYG
jgi:hypothetical protein